MNYSKMIKPLSITFIALCYLFISTGCEPDPKMIGYGSNEYSQLEFPGTNWNHEPLLEGYQNVWAGGNFSIAYNNGGYYNYYYDMYYSDFQCDKQCSELNFIP